jgi:Protein of unknown function (DUF4229)
MSDQPTFRRSMGVLWLYTALRFGMFFVLFGVLWLVGVSAFLAAIIAVVLSLPLSYVLLARPRAALAANLEQRVNARKAHTDELNAKLNGEDD